MQSAIDVPLSSATSHRRATAARVIQEQFGRSIFSRMPKRGTMPAKVRIEDLAETASIWKSRQSSVGQKSQFNQAGKFEQHAKFLPPLEVLHCLLVFLCLRLCPERAEISSFARFWIFLARIQPVLPGFQFPDHLYRVFAAETDPAG